MPNLPYKRSERLARLLHQRIAEIVSELKEPELGFVTITDLELSDDLSVAKVFYSVLKKEEIKPTQEILSNAAEFIRYHLGKEIRLKKMPKLEFFFDETPERAVRIFELLDKISKEKKTRK
ncbi:MAG: 30S ribosome-binding factor RbfA [Elusimicrobiota bacterium]|nr:30S ribosome-binding factor RbfA [Elusimicrobiota bacterium]